MKIDPKSPAFSIAYGVFVALIAASIARNFDSPFLRLPIFLIFYILGYAFALYNGWTVLEHKSESMTKPDTEDG